MTNERLSKKQKDILKGLVWIENELKKETKQKNLKEINNSIKFQFVLNALGLNKNETNKKSAYRSLQNLEAKGLVKIERLKGEQGKFFKNVLVTKKGKEFL